MFNTVVYCGPMKGTRWLQGLLYAGLLVAAYSLGRWQRVPPVPKPPDPPRVVNAVPIPRPSPRPGIEPGTLPVPAPVPAPIKSEAEQAFDLGQRAASLSVKEMEQQWRQLSGEVARQFAIGLGHGLAATKAPIAVMKLCQDLPRPLRGEVLRGTTLEWIQRTARVDATTRARLMNELTALSLPPNARDAIFTGPLATAKVADNILNAWKTTASSGPQRAQSLASMSTVTSSATADEWFRQTQGWTTWEREQFAQEALNQWAGQDPDAAWRWVQANLELATTSGMRTVLNAMDESSITRLASSVIDTAPRLAVIAELAERKAMSDTATAVQWADSLATDAEREAAQGAIYDATPRGIGAVLGVQDGFPVVSGLTHDSAAKNAGLLPGDRLVEIANADGSKHALHDVPLSTVITYIRGEPGTTVRLRILRTSPDGRTTEQWIPVTRQQVMFKPRP